MGTVLVTGSTAGLGLEVARRLAERGESVLVHGRDQGRLAAGFDETGAAGSFLADLSSLAEVRRLAAEVGEAHGRIDLLVNNAGIIAGPDRRESADGYELGFAVNYLAGFGLWRELRPRRVINVSSIGQQAIDFDDVMLERGFSGSRAYAQSKLAQVMATIDLAEELAGDGVTVNALHPATLMDTTMVRETFGGARTTVREGADATLRLIADPALQDVTGRYFQGTRESEPHSQALDPEARATLRELSERLTGST